MKRKTSFSPTETPPFSICIYYNSFARGLEAGWGDIVFGFSKIHSASSDTSSASTNTVDTCTGTGSRLDLIACMTASVKSAQQGLSVLTTVILGDTKEMTSIGFDGAVTDTGCGFGLDKPRKNFLNCRFGCGFYNAFSCHFGTPCLLQK